MAQSTAQSAPGSLTLDWSKYEKLSPAQVGHLRHFHNLAYQPDSEWSKMSAQEPLQHFLDAYRYQLTTMAYATRAAHYHRLAALRSICKPLLRRLIHKMLRRGVWACWFTTSLGGVLTDPSLKKLREPWAAPVERESIMYSGHLLPITSLYAMLFDNGEFEEPDSLVFRWDPMFFGLGPETFSCDNQSPEAAITREMERNDLVGGLL